MNLLSVRVGKVASLGKRRTAFVKHPVETPIAVTETGLAGDEVGDLRHHGGPDKAVYGYPFAHYAAWRADFPEHAALLIPGGFGENLTIDGADETTLCLGDRLLVGTAELIACQPRQPCRTLALRYGDPRMVAAMTRTGRSGWYFRVAQPGRIGPGAAVELLDRPNPEWPFARFLRLLRNRRFSAAELRALAAMPGLAAQWQNDAAERLGRTVASRIQPNASRSGL